MTTQTVTPAPMSTWAPLAVKVFRALWIAGLISNVGSSVHGVAAGWLMTDLSAAASTVALLAAATALPSFLLALPSGALADVFDRRKLLIVSQVLMGLAALVLAVLHGAGKVNIVWLLAMSVVLSIGGTLNMPNWVALAPELLPREQLPSAGALNAISMNTAGALGPAIGGLIVGSLGVSWAFALNALSFLVVAVVVWMWKREAPEHLLPAEHVGSAVRAGLRYAVNDPGLGPLLIRIVMLALGLTALSALLPVIARVELGLGAGQFGLVTTAMGASAVLVSFALPRLRRVFGPDRFALLGGLLLAAGLLVVAQARSMAMLIVGVALVAAGQTSAFSTTFATIQAVLPGWVRGRGLAVAMLSFQGSIFVSSLVWGAVAGASGTTNALRIAAGVAAIAAVAIFPIRLATRATAEVAPLHSTPHGHHDVDERSGPVLVTTRWRIDPGQAVAFAAAMAPMRRLRRRTGALHWGLFHQVDDPGLFVEVFSVASWVEHERQHARSTVADGHIHSAARAFLVGAEIPETVHHLAAPAGRSGLRISPIGERIRHTHDAE